MRRVSRRRLIERIDDIYATTRHAPIMSARVVVQRPEQNESVVHVSDSKDRLIQILADLSLTHRIVDVYRTTGYVSSGIRATVVRFYLNPDKNYTTNIDDEMLEHIVRLEWI